MEPAVVNILSENLSIDLEVLHLHGTDAKHSLRFAGILQSCPIIHIAQLL